MTREEFILNYRSMTGEEFVSKTLYSLKDLYYTQPSRKMPVVWVEATACGGNTISLLNALDPDLNQILLGLIDLKYSNTLMIDEGDEALKTLRRVSERPGGFLLIVEGAIATQAQGRFNFVAVEDGKMLTGANLIASIAPRAHMIMAAGTCASFGGPSAARPNLSGSVGVGKFLGRKVINAAGCPAHPDWIIGTLAHLLLFGEPEVDEHGRPLLFYGETVHDRCTRRSFFDQRIFAKKLGDPECMFSVGCKGPLTHADCPSRLWNSYLSWPVKANAPCIGCTEPTYPDGMMPFFEQPFPLEGGPPGGEPGRPPSAGRPGGDGKRILEDGRDTSSGNRGDLYHDLSETREGERK